MHKYVTYYQSISGYRTMLVVDEVPECVSDKVYPSVSEAEKAARHWARQENCTYLSDQSAPSARSRVKPLVDSPMSPLLAPSASRAEASSPSHKLGMRSRSGLSILRDAAAALSGIPVEKLFNGSRLRAHVQWRMAVIYLGVHCLGRSGTQISAGVGHRNRTSMVYGVAQCERALARRDKALARRIVDLFRAVNDRIDRPGSPEAWNAMERRLRRALKLYFPNLLTLDAIVGQYRIETNTLGYRDRATARKVAAFIAAKVIDAGLDELLVFGWVGASGARRALNEVENAIARGDGVIGLINEALALFESKGYNTNAMGGASLKQRLGRGSGQ